MRLNDPELVRQQYETEAGLAVRRDAVARFREGPDAVDAALLAAVAAPSPRRVLEVGCGMGQFAERMLAELAVDLIAVDLSPRMVELARERGIDARVGDAQRLAFRNGQFECVVANWMLYHVDDLDLYIESSFFSAAVLRPLPEPDVPFRCRTVNAVFVAETAA
jgi:SAM-dependent methyltransferase